MVAGLLSINHGPESKYTDDGEAIVRPRDSCGLVKCCDDYGLVPLATERKGAHIERRGSFLGQYHVDHV